VAEAIDLKPLFEAIYTYANTASNFKTAIGGRFYLHEAPQAATFPFAVYTMVSLDPEYYLGGNQLLRPYIQLSIFSNDIGATEVTTIWGYMCSRFDDAAINVTGYGTVEFRRSQSRLLRDPEPVNIWHYATDYELLLGV
jgi:hypothetical protein